MGRSFEAPASVHSAYISKDHKAQLRNPAREIGILGALGQQPGTLVSGAIVGTASPA